MNAIHAIKLLMRHKNWLLLTPIICAATVFVLTRNTKKQYVSSTTLYTGVASGYSITSTGDEKLDYFAVNNAFDNLLASAKSRETIEQVALHLLAEHLLLKKPNPQVLNAAGFENLKKLAGGQLMEKAQSLKDEKSVYNYISFVFASKVDNVIARILSKPGSFYSIDDLKSNLVVTRIATSDILSVVYTCSDPAVCLRTLELHTKIFTENYSRLKSDQTYSAVQYFEAKLAEAKEKLRISEDDLKDFGQKNRLINYYEQTRYIAQSKEQLDKEIYAEKVIQSGGQRALALIEKRLNSREKQITNSLEVMNLRKRLSDVNADVERAKIFANKEKTAEFTKMAIELEDSLKAASNQYMKLNYTLETVPRAGLIQQWIDNAVILDKANAGLAVLTNQRQDYLKEFDEFAPLGSTLKRLDRQVDINEKEFTAILQGLNLARLRQSNLALNANVVVQDKPYFPLQAQASIRMILVLASFLVGFIAVVSVVLGKEFMDSSIRSPERAKKIITLPLAGISIVHTATPQPYQVALKNLLTEQLINTLLPHIATAIEDNKQAQISMISIKDGIFNATDITLLHQSLLALFNNVFWIVPTSYAGVFASALKAGSFESYAPTVEQLNYKAAAQLVKTDISAQKLIIYLSPNLSQHGLPTTIVRQSNTVLLVFKADDTWNAADKEALVKIKSSVLNIPLATWLVNTDEANLDGVVGEIPKKRSWLRKKVKKMMSLNLK